jgi:hypothetical protein
LAGCAQGIVNSFHELSLLRINSLSLTSLDIEEAVVELGFIIQELGFSHVCCSMMFTILMVEDFNIVTLDRHLP